ncbi:diguanylate cyclase [Granulicella sp. 5B5]|uniref:GGDEF domain-containing protein n=1 Tax=Granulicella sp. 5B5 TaxID=1617967 RepID=UPI0015F354D4|nr:sensor domain-containing diguanylate cyclase [Granulicella sp. 5B5]QMV18939.1 diguanylate cyclase [Granulicella sp. 5B5]
MREKRQIESIDSRQLESLRVFHEVASALTSSLKLEDLLRTIMAQMEDFFGPEQWSLLLLDEDAKELRYALSAGIDEELLKDVRLPLGEGIAGYVAESGDPLVVPDVSVDPDWSQYAAAHPELHLQSIACLPILHGNRTLAVLQLHNSKLDLLPDSSISFLRVLCDYTAIALENARHVKLIHHLTITDDCTGLFNARCLYDMLEAEIKASTNGGKRVVPINLQHFSLLFLDLDHFKSINDTHGHLIGSRLLAEIGGVIKRTIGPEHVAFRYGGDEFVCLLRELDKPAALELAKALHTALATTPFLASSGMNIAITGSFGLATFPQDGGTLQDIVRSADTMMYKAKAEGRNRISVADSSKPITDIAPIKGSRHT